MLTIISWGPPTVKFVAWEQQRAAYRVSEGPELSPVVTGQSRLELGVVGRTCKRDDAVCVGFWNLFILACQASDLVPRAVKYGYYVNAPVLSESAEKAL